ncbi:predicted protein [Chaetoceros tenuissimus]|uniref:Uncharacterized protein n=1 Tax=Chaetoceros tenuissimus TaxID=426638 RepID=A0AAD3GZ74_9STRA|nr:predicted protein [Chaetoceros tenuissimus]
MRNDYPDYVRLHDRKWGHHKCSYLPEENEEIDIFYPYSNAPKSIHANRNWFTGHFQFAVATNVDEKKCTFTAVPTNTKYAPIEKKAYPDPTIWPIVFTIFGMYALAKEETSVFVQKVQDILSNEVREM